MSLSEDEGKKSTKGKHKKSSASANVSNLSNLSMDESFSSRNRSCTDFDLLEQPVPRSASSSQINELIGLCRSILQRQQSLEDNLMRRHAVVEEKPEQFLKKAKTQVRRSI